MATPNTLQSYSLNGVKESFANWVSNISPADTPFTSLTGKEAVKNKYFQWQTDKLNPVAGSGTVPQNAQAEGSDADQTVGATDTFGTTLQKNVTQILRKVVKVSDTADALSNWGRGSELQYQMEKAAKELKRDIEWAFLNQETAQDTVPPGTATTAANIRKFAGFTGLVATKGANSPEDTSAIVHKDATVAGTLSEGDLFDVTQALYLAGAKPTHIMFHPTHAKFFSSLMEKDTGTRQRMFDGSVDTKVNTYVSCLVDPLGQQLCLLPNRFMPVEKVYIFNPTDWTQMVLREPSRIQLAKDGSYEKWMIEVELGLRHRNPFASGILVVGTTTAPIVKTITAATAKASAVGGDKLAFSAMFTATGAGAADFDYVVTPTAAGTVNVTTGELTLADVQATTGPVTVKATAKTATGAVTGSPATFTITAVSSKLTGLEVDTTATGGTVGGTAAAPTLAITAFATPAVLTVKPVPATAKLPAALTFTDPADVVTTFQTPNKASVKAGKAITAAEDLVIKAGSVSLTVKVTSA